MDKLSIDISPQDWGNLVTKYRPDSKKVSLADFTDGTVNIDTDVTGSLTKRKGGVNYNATALSAAPKDQFEAIFTDGARHLLVVANGEIRYSSGDTIFNSVVNGTGFSTGANFEFATTQDRVYGGNVVNSPIVYDRSTSYGGVSYTAPRIKTMGAQAPSSAPTAGAPTAGGNVPNGAHTYKITFLYYDFEESNGSSASGVQTAGAGNNTIPLTAIPIGGYGVTARKIYRDNNDGLWLHIATLSNNTATTFSDTISVGTTPTEIPQFNDVPPSFGLIKTWLDRQWLGQVAGDPSTLFYTETSMPDIVRPENVVLCNQEDPITAFVVYYGRLVVFNRRSMGQILGTTSDTFRYSAIPSSIGCVDNRTLQTRVIEGVPILIWLSDRGFYSYDGNSINYISDPIEDLVNFNIQQTLQQKNSISQSVFTGTAEDGISLTEVPGSITTRGYLEGTSTPGTNPRRNWDDQGDWEGGSVTTNIRTKDGDGTLRVPTKFAPASYTDGTNSGTTGTTSLTLPTSTDFTGESHLAPLTDFLQFAVLDTSEAQSITTTRSGNITGLTFKIRKGPASGVTSTVNLSVWNDVAGQPGTIIFTGTSVVLPPTLTTTTHTLSQTGLSVALIGGQRYWIGVRIVSSSLSLGANVTTLWGSTSADFAGESAKRFNGSSWVVPTTSGGSFSLRSYRGEYTFCASANSSSGIWTSAIYDSLSAYISTILNITHTSSTASAVHCTGPAALLVQTTIEGSNLATFAGGAQVSQTQGNINGTFALTLSGKRYWRIKIALTSTDDRDTPTVGLPVLTFATTSTWESESIDTTLQSTTYNSLVTSSTVPAGTSVTTTIATSVNSAGPWTGIGNADGQFGAFGSHVVRQFVRIRVVLIADTTDTTTPVVSSVILKWTISAKYLSTIIDTGVNPPAGWDIFLADFTTNGGTVTFAMRSAATSGGIAGATFYTVIPSEFPTIVAPNQFTQWRVILVSSDEDVPQIDSVTVQWFISSIASIRPASIFTDGRYYVALAEVGNLLNNVLLELDLKGKWRRHSGLQIATFSFFFNRPYLGLSTAGQIVRFLEGFLDSGAIITFDFRSKAADYSTQYQNNSSKVKVAGEVILQGVNTGASFQLSYSLDNTTFIPMLTSSGLSTYISASDGADFFVRFRPTWDGSTAISGRAIMYRIYSNDAHEVEIKGLSALAFLRNQAPVITG